MVYRQYSHSGNPVLFEDSLSGSSPITVTLNTNVFPLWVTAANNAKAYIISGTGSIGGIAPLNKTGSGTLTLSGANTYHGDTTVDGGTLLVNNPTGSGTGTGSMTVNSGGTLGGTGIIWGATTINFGGTLAPGVLGGLGRLTISNDLILAEGSTSLFQVQHSPMTNSAVNLSGTLSAAGTLVVTNSGVAALTNGDSFKLFAAASYDGNFAQLTLPPLGSGLAWNISSLYSNGIIAVVALPAPHISGIQIIGSDLVMNGSGGPANWPYSVMAATNLPAIFWTPVATNQFDANGDFSLTLTNAMNPTQSQVFYRIQLQ